MRETSMTLKVHRDKQLKAERGYANPRSIVYEDGREKLAGSDWANRKYALLIRSKGKCERTAILGKPHAEKCSGAAEEPHHIISRWKCRDDRIQNLAALSHACHLAEDKRQPKWSKSVGGLRS
jgi:hypothetical protein